MFEEINSPDEGFSWFESFTNLEKTPAGVTREYRLDRMGYLASLFDNPQKSYRVIHTAGSKGKGSTSAFIASGLKAAGFKTGLYTSPHVTNYRERIALVGEDISEEIYLSNIRLIKDKIDNIPPANFPGSGEPTTFELMTLLALLVFRDLACEWAVLETGLGGRLDATNIVVPEVSVITPIELEHTEYLGNTIEEIAGEKGGIIKQGKPVFCGLLKESAEKIIEEIASARNAPLISLKEAGSVKSIPIDSSEGPVLETEVIWKKTGLSGKTGTSRWKLSMQGPHQGQNAALAALVVGNLKEKMRNRPGMKQFDRLSDELLDRALETTRLPGRMELFRYRNSSWVLDGAHTPDSLRLTISTFRLIHGEKGILVFGSAAGKPVAPLARETEGKFRDIIITRAGDFKPENPEKVYRIFQDSGFRIQDSEKPKPEDGLTEISLVPEPEEAFRMAVELAGKDGADRPVLVTGSFYTAGVIRPMLINNFAETGNGGR